MTSALSFTLYLTFIAFLALIGCRYDHVVEGLSCASCFHRNGTYKGPTCEALPRNNTACEQTFNICACCPECAGEEGDLCGGQSVRCRQGLCCVNEEGRTKEEVEWYEQFSGVCNQVDNCPQIM